MKLRRALVTFACALSLPATAQPVALEEADAPLSLDQALALAMEHNKLIAAARLRQVADRAAIDVAKERPNPDLRFEAAKETPRQSLTASQEIEIAGKRGHRIAVASAAARAGEAETAMTIAETRGAVRRGYYALAAVQRRIQIAEEVRGLTERTRDAASARFELGDASRLEVLQAELALLQAETEARGLGGELSAARSALNALVGRAPSSPTTASDDIETAQLPELETLALRASSESAAGRQIEAEIAEAEARVALARSQRIPDPALEAAVTHDSPPEFDYGWRFAVGLAIPLFTHHGAQVQLEEATLSRLRLERDALVDRLGGQLAAAVARANSQREGYLRFRDEVLPRALQVEAMANDSYRSGQTGLSALLQSLQA